MFKPYEFVTETLTARWSTCDAPESGDCARRRFDTQEAMQDPVAIAESIASTELGAARNTAICRPAGKCAIRTHRGIRRHRAQACHAACSTGKQGRQHQGTLEPTSRHTSRLCWETLTFHNSHSEDSRVGERLQRVRRGPSGVYGAFCFALHAWRTVTHTSYGNDDTK